MRLGIICPSEIAFRRFLPTLSFISEITFAGVGVNTIYERYGGSLPERSVVEETIQRGKNKAQDIVKQYGGRVFESFSSIVSSPDIDALYIPLPPALHYRWAREALEHGKHVLIEKPATVSLDETNDLIKLAGERGLAVHENYMFVFHNQIEVVNNLISAGEIGEVRQYNLRFGFPKRSPNDFRYSKSAGGGALLDAGGYPLKYADMLLGPSAKIRFANLKYVDSFDVDIFGSAVLENDQGVCANVSFGMDNDYKCELEVWGSSGTILADRIFTAPSGYSPKIFLKKGQEQRILDVDADDTFLKSIQWFLKCVESLEVREENYRAIVRQAELLNSFYIKAAEGS